MKNITVFSGFNKPLGNKDLREFLREVKNGRFKAEVEKIRLLIREGHEEEAQQLKKLLTAVTICALYIGGRRDANLTKYCGMVILDLDDLSLEEVVRLRAVIEADKHTYACFVSPGGLGLKVLVPVAREDGSLPVDIEEIKKFHREAYNRVMRYYKALTAATIDMSGKDVGRLCYVSYDPLLFLNERADVFITGVKCVKDIPLIEDVEIECTEEMSPETIFGKCVRYTTKKQTYKEGNRNVFINLLANNCNRRGLAKEDTERFCLAKYVDMETEELLSTIRSAYTHASEHAVVKNTRNTQGVFDDVENFLTEKYEIHYNVVSTRLQIRKKDSKNDFENLTDRTENSVWRAVNKSGVKCKISDIRSLLLSDLYPSFNPFIAYFQKLPKWDGHDYIAQLSTTVKTDDDVYWLFCFRKWLVAMAASLIEKETVNHVVPVFCGNQGRGKTRWTVKLLPPELQVYYATASITEQEKDLLLKLSHRALVNIDELEVLKSRDMAKLKKIITQISIDERKAYGRNEETYTRHASLLASSNNQKVLNDPTGSRRFITFLVNTINDAFSIDYLQLYAQIKHLIDSGFRFWFNIEEIEELDNHNDKFRSRSPEEEFLFVYFRKPLPGESCRSLLASEILKRISDKTGLKITGSGINLLGKVLNKHGFESKRLSKGDVYTICELDFNEVERNSKTTANQPQDVVNEPLITEPELPF